MIILSLDVATKCGWAVDGPGGKPRLGVFNNPSAGRGRGPVCLHFSNWLYPFAKACNPDMIVAEAPAFGGKTKLDEEGKQTGFVMSAAVAGLLIGLETQVEVVAASLNVEFRSAHVQTVRRHFVGNGRPKNPKAVVMARCRQLGWDPPDDNAADAAALWDWAKSTYDRKSMSPPPTALFAPKLPDAGDF